MTRLRSDPKLSPHSICRGEITWSTICVGGWTLAKQSYNPVVRHMQAQLLRQRSARTIPPRGPQPGAVRESGGRLHGSILGSIALRVDSPVCTPESAVSYYCSGLIRPYHHFLPLPAPRRPPRRFTADSCISPSSSNFTTVLSCLRFSRTSPLFLLIAKRVRLYSTLAFFRLPEPLTFHEAVTT